MKLTFLYINYSHLDKYLCVKILMQTFFFSIFQNIFLKKLCIATFLFLLDCHTKICTKYLYEKPKFVEVRLVMLHHHLIHAMVVRSR